MGQIQKFKLNSLHIEYLGEDQNANPPLVFLHGWGFNHSIWHSLTPHLSLFPLYLVDLPGYGQSRPMSWSAFKRHLIQHVQRPFIIVGWSLGGLYAMRLAVEEHDVVSSLILLCASPCFIKQGSWPGISTFFFNVFLQQFKENPQQTLNEFMLTHTADHHCIKDDSILDLEASIGLSPLSPNLSNALTNGLHDLRDLDFRSELQQLNQPTCCIFGELDPIVPFETLKTMQDDYPEFTYHGIAQAGHSPFLSHATQVANLIERFIVDASPKA